MGDSPNYVTKRAAGRVPQQASKRQNACAGIPALHQSHSAPLSRAICGARHVTQVALRLMQAVQQAQGGSGGLGQIMSQLMSDPAVMDGVQGLLGGLTQQPSESRCM